MCKSSYLKECYQACTKTHQGAKDWPDATSVDMLGTADSPCTFAVRNLTAGFKTQGDLENPLEVLRETVAGARARVTRHLRDEQGIDVRPGPPRRGPMALELHRGHR